MRSDAALVLLSQQSRQQSPRPSFQQRFNFVEKRFPSAVYDLQPWSTPPLECIDNLRAAMARVFVATGSRDFFLLHCITSADALAQVAALLPAASPLHARLIRTFWRHVCVAYVAQVRRHFGQSSFRILSDLLLPQGLPALDSPPPDLNEYLDEAHFQRLLVDHALPHDEHLLKLGCLAHDERARRLHNTTNGPLAVAFVTAVEKIVVEKRGFVF
jgi:hypothetical protein